MGSEEHKEMIFWTIEKYRKFTDEMMDKPILNYFCLQICADIGHDKSEVEDYV